ncbi:hypothetical protein L6452_38863 [Arctium lappa]|uniref:Uncharacterized protein n=1 Tax=Arctium lappa TaxID=4217 RepID=A0ACB8XQY4_ARCLA|nr:hypothetical protein L6452_38863 [Arctium lappa]
MASRGYSLALIYSPISTNSPFTHSGRAAPTHSQSHPSPVTEQAMDEKLGRMVTRVMLPRVVMLPHVAMLSRHHYGAFSENFTGLELEDGRGRGTSGSHWEKRLLKNEIMTGSVDTRSVVSKMALALLEDSG